MCLQVGLVDFFLPFFPLERPHIQQLFGMHLAERSAALEGQGVPGLDWGQDVIQFLTDKVSMLRLQIKVCMCELLGGLGECVSAVGGATLSALWASVALGHDVAKFVAGESKGASAVSLCQIAGGL